MENIKGFLADSAIKVDDVEVIVSRRFLDEQKKPIPWKIKVLEAGEFDRILNAHKKKVVDPQTRQQVSYTDTDKAQDELVLACVSYPNLNSTELQNSYGVFSAGELIKKMLSPGEYNDLSKSIQQANGFDAGMEEKIKEAKN